MKSGDNTTINGSEFGLEFDLDIGKAYRLKYKDNVMADTDCILSFVDNDENCLVFFGNCGVNISKVFGARAFILKGKTQNKYIFPKQFMVRVSLEQILSGEINIVKLVEDKNEILD